MDKKLLLMTVFVSGTILMSLEMIGSRMLAPYFGNSIYVWGNLIGIIMLAISVGYYVGGKIADSNSSVKLPYFMITIAALYILFILFIYKPLLSMLLGFGILYGSIISTFLLFAAPMFLLSLIPPYIIKLFTSTGKVGSSVGTVNSVSTIGNIFGVYFSSFIIIPHLGTRLSLHFAFLTLLLTAIIGLIRINRKFLLLSLFSFLLLLTPTYSLDESVVLEIESPYNHIILRNESDELRLFLNTEKHMHSVYNKEYYLSQRYYQFFLLMPTMTQVDDLLILGMGGGTSIDQFMHYYPDIKIDAVEIDPKVIEIAEQYFDVKETSRIKIFSEDARSFLSKTKKKYDAIEIDLFKGTPYIPFYVVTKEFFELVYFRLDEGGVMMMNVFDPNDDNTLLHSIENTILSVFPSLYKINYGPNNILIATKQQTDSIIMDPASENDIQNIINSAELVPIIADEKALILTDDYAPVEPMSRNAIGGY